MSVFSNRLFCSPERPIDPHTLSVLLLIDRLLRDAGISYMLVGATARDLLLYHVFGHPVTRATYDLDFAIFMDSWEQFASVKQLFLNTPGFTGRERIVQRLFYQPPGTAFKTVVDIIPFGKLETAAQTIIWPPDAEVIMNVAAFRDVFQHALQIEVHQSLVIPVASLPGLAILKLFAWLDRHDGRDVQDIRRLIETYSDAGNFERLYDEEASELERVGFDTTLAGAFLLGRDARRITNENVRAQLQHSLSGKQFSELVCELARTISLLEDRTDSAQALLGAFMRGMGMVDR